MRHISAILASLLGLTILNSGASAANFGDPLQCAPSMSPSIPAAASSLKNFTPGVLDIEWVEASMDRIGYRATVPTTAPLRDPAILAAALLRNGHIVAAKMANDDAGRTNTAYSGSPFARSFEALLTAFTQPVLHASYPTNVRAVGEAEPASRTHTHTHGVDIEQASGSLSEVIARVGNAQRALGQDYRRPEVRYYILAQGFRDGVALTAAAARLCAGKPAQELKDKLDVSARYVAMPSQFAPPELPQ